MKHNFKVGDKVKIPTQKTKRTLVGLEESLSCLRVDANTKFLVIATELNAYDQVIGIENPNCKNSYRSYYGQNDLELYQEEMTIPKVLSQQLDGTIIEVQDIDGAIYKINDQIVLFSNPGKPMTIRRFKWNYDITNILAITNSYPINGIGINKIELFIEEPTVKQETLLEEAIRRYPIGTKFINAFKGVDRGIKTVDDYPFKEATIASHGKIGVYWQNEWINYNGEWAKIIEEVQPEPEFVLPEVWHIKVTNENIDTITQYWRLMNENSTVSFTTENYIGNTKWINCSYHQRLGFGFIKNLQLNPTPPNNRAYYYNGVEITTEQFIEFVLPEELKPKVEIEVKVEEFVLPVKWYIRLTKDNREEVISYINKNTNDEYRNGLLGSYYGFNGEHCTRIIAPNKCEEITFEQFQKYVNI